MRSPEVSKFQLFSLKFYNTLSQAPLKITIYQSAFVQNARRWNKKKEPPERHTFREHCQLGLEFLKRTLKDRAFRSILERPPIRGKAFVIWKKTLKGRIFVGISEKLLSKKILFPDVFERGILVDSIRCGKLLDAEFEIWCEWGDRI